MNSPIVSVASFALGLIVGVLPVVGVRQAHDRPQAQSPAATARYEAAKALWEDAAFQAKTGQYQMGAAEDEDRFRWSLRLAESAVAAGAVLPPDAFRQHLDRMRE